METQGKLENKDLPNQQNKNFAGFKRYFSQFALDDKMTFKRCFN